MAQSSALLERARNTDQAAAIEQPDEKPSHNWPTDSTKNAAGSMGMTLTTGSRLKRRFVSTPPVSMAGLDGDADHRARSSHCSTLQLGNGEAGVKTRRVRLAVKLRIPPGEGGVRDGPGARSPGPPGSMKGS